MPLDIQFLADHAKFGDSPVVALHRDDQEMYRR